MVAAVLGIDRVARSCRAAVIWRRLRVPPRQRAALLAGALLAQIPPDAPLSAQSNLLPHLSQRRFIRDFPRIDQAEYVVIDLKSWGIWQTDFEPYVRILRGLPSIGFRRIAEDDGIEL